LQGQDPLAVRASRKLKNDEQLITQFSAARLSMEMDHHNLWGEGNHVGLKQLWEYFARYPYLPRLLNSGVLLDAVQQAFQQTTWHENLAYAEGWDEARQRYLNLKAGQLGSVVMDARSVAVRPDAALRQIEADKAALGAQSKPQDKHDGGQITQSGGQISEVKPVELEKKLRRFYGTAELDATRMGRDAGQIAENIVPHLSSLVGAKVTITIDIQAELPDGAPDNVVRTVTENARTLKFKSSGFEEG